MNPTDSPTHFSHLSRASSTINFVVILFDLAFMCEILILQDFHSNDHFPLVVNINCLTCTSTTFSRCVEND